ncbi:hypothetical protein P0D69_44330 [Paraburkholderia sediminicola]|uniref:hypothetical protein n=1 Tax=Paraburkholderia sediminicola TaxID=458836 RepID=UPI0038B98B9C
MDAASFGARVGEKPYQLIGHRVLSHDRCRWLVPGLGIHQRRLPRIRVREQFGACHQKLPDAFHHLFVLQKIITELRPVGLGVRRRVRLPIIVWQHGNPT